MNWFVLALVGPALWSISNHLDKYLISKYFRGGGIGALIIFSSIFSIFVLPVIYLIEPNVFKIQPFQAFILWLESLTYVVGTIIYLYALRRDETSIVVPMLQIIPVFGYFVAFIVLGETLTTKQILASLVIILSAIFLSLDLTNKIPRVKIGVLLLMLLSSFIYSISGVLFKFAALQATFWVSTFWSNLGLLSIGIFFLIFVKQYRQQFASVLRINKSFVIGLNSFNEFVNMVAGMTTSYAALLVPITLVWVVNGFQPFFVFVYGIILTLFFPKLGSESLLKRHLAQKIVAITIMFLGTFFLNS